MSRFWINGVRAILLCMFLAAMGCDPGVGQITGSFRLKDQVLKSDEHFTWEVVFLTQDGKRHATTVGRDGQYSLKNVPPGPVKVAVKGGPSVPDGLLRPDQRKVRPEDEALLKRLGKFRDPGKSNLIYTVVQGRQTMDFVLDEP
jgi:hypothetical protein